MRPAPKRENQAAIDAESNPVSQEPSSSNGAGVSRVRVDGPGARAASAAGVAVGGAAAGVAVGGAAAGVAVGGSAAAAVVVAALVWRPPPGSLDDVYVVLADARAWLLALAGRGEPPLVEGSTSALDVGVKAATLALLPDTGDALRWTGFVGVGLLVAAVLCAAAFAARLGRREGGVAALVGAAFVVGAGVGTGLGVLEATAFRLEGPLHLLVWTIAVGAVALGAPRTALATAFPLALVRPEALLLTPLAAALAAKRRAGVLRLAAAGAFVAACVTALRFAVFGAWVPNTYHAKASDSRLAEFADGVAYVGSALSTPPGFSLFALAGFVLWRGDGRARALVGLAAAALLLLVASGGDGYEGARLALPLGAPLWLAYARSLAVAPRAGRLALPLGLVCLALQLAPAATRAQARPHPLAETLGRIAAGPVGSELHGGEPLAIAAAARALDGETLAFRHAQRLRWFAPDLALLDMTGLTDAEVARRPHPGRNTFGRDALDLALGRRVGAIHLTVGFGSPEPLARFAPSTALADPEVHQRFIGAFPVAPDALRVIEAQYRPASLAFPAGDGRASLWFDLLVRSDLVERFRAEGFVVRD